MSDQKTPQNKRHRRRRDGSASRSMFVDEQEQREKQNRKFIDKSQEEVEKIENRRKDKRETITVNSKAYNIKSIIEIIKSIRLFETKDTGDSERRIRRNKRNAKTLMFLVGGAIVIILVVVGSILLFAGKSDKNNNQPLTTESTKTEINVTIHYNDTVKTVVTEAETVGEVLSQNDIVLADKQEASHTDETKVIDGMEIFISEAMTVTVLQNSISNSVTMYGGRVKDVFAELEIELDSHDIVAPHVDTLLTDQMKITFTDVEVKEVTEIEELDYNTQEGETDTVEEGYYHVEKEGVNGLAEVTYQIKYINGVEEFRTEIKRETVEEPVDRVILWGTVSKSSNSSSDDGDDSSYDDIIVKNPGEQATNPDIPAAPIDYIELFSGHVTAYTHTGNTTATGTWPRSTRTLENPGSCAVVPVTIPYGSLLYVTGYGYCIAEDTGGFRHDPDRWNQIDLFMNTEDECWTWGRRRDVKVYILRWGY